MQTNGCWTLGACFLAWALANLSISLASPRGSILSVLWRVTTHGLLPWKISRAHWRAVFTNSSAETMASTRPRLWASSPLTGSDFYLSKPQDRGVRDERLLKFMRSQSKRKRQIIITAYIPASYQVPLGDQQDVEAAVYLRGMPGAMNFINNINFSHDHSFLDWTLSYINLSRRN